MTYSLCVDFACRLRSYVCWSWPFQLYGHSGWLKYLLIFCLLFFYAILLCSYRPGENVFNNFSCADCIHLSGISCTYIGIYGSSCVLVTTSQCWSTNQLLRLRSRYLLPYITFYRKLLTSSINEFICIAFPGFQNTYGCYYLVT